MAKKNLLFLLIIFLAFILRVFGINWDQGFHLHPDERMLIMVTDKINFFKNLNPNFFNYGTLPIYLLRIIAPKNDYYSLLTSGRILSIFFDLLTLIFIYKITSILFKEKKISLLASFFYSLTFFSIQNSHFFVVDVFLTTFTTCLIYLLLLYLKKNSLKKTVFIALFFAAMMATKFTAVIFYPLILLVIVFKRFFSKKPQLKQFVVDFLTFNFSLLTFHFLFMPYAYLDWQNYSTAVFSQLKMNSNPYIFPYTLQYVQTLPYLYYLKNIFIWGLGPFISILGLTGLFYLGKTYLFKNKLIFQVFAFFYFFYFLIIGRSSVKFMRYMLPLYPFLAILAGYGFYIVISSKKKLIKYLGLILLLGSIIWTSFFMNIYSQQHTRVVATDWILENIPSGSTIAIEHWDDKLPLYSQEKYYFEELSLYDQPDNTDKWQILNQKLKKSDYIIIASNRLYTPLQKLADCNKYTLCYPNTAGYYKKLFSEKLGYRKVKEFVVSPGFQILNLTLQIDDQTADESFTVYDHPKITIYKKLH